ncbi:MULTISPECIES: ankyrin repeat domain-containing protein [unclassified Legionella]|uniref:ankyrin repeat domain-containing protein n=1 Tax=unclassified Legionella TaxID=2622702 RepID=UPI001055D1F0|nr:MULTISPECIES: ankyrin repeat domain-containing protein [unclassified Legionella]MDI9819426.1 ankyrin repeat domain-containing protein [Legionella sp. PL877]
MLPEDILRESIREGDTQRFIDNINYADIDASLARDKQGNNLAHLAARFNQPAIMEAIIKAVENITADLPILEQINDNGYSPLECCYLYSAPETAEKLQGISRLTRATAPIVTQNHEQLKKQLQRCRYPEKARAALLAIALNDIAAYQLLLNSVPDKKGFINYKANDGWSALHFAVYNKRFEAVQFLLKSELLEEGTEPKDNEQNTPFLIAVGTNDLRIINCLIKSNCDIHWKNKRGENAVNIAATQGQLENVNFLIEKNIDMMSVDKEGRNSLMSAARHGHSQVVQRLKEAGVPADKKDKQGKTAFQLALGSHHLETASLLLDICTQEEKNQALLDAVQEGNLSTVEWLVKHGASLSVRDSSDNSPLLIAAAYGWLPIVHYLLDQESPPIHDKDNDGNNALSIAVINHKQPIVERLLQFNPLLLGEKNNNGHTPLLMAAITNYDKVLKLFHRQGYSLEEKDNEGNTLLHLALASKYYGTAVSYLLKEHGYLLNEKNAKGQTPLHLAIIHNQDSYLNELINLSKETVDTPDNEVNTPLLTALVHQNINAIRLLINAGADVFAKNNKGDTALTIPHLRTLPEGILQKLLTAYNINHEEFKQRCRLYFIFGGEKLNEVLDFPKTSVNFGSGTFDEGMQILSGHLKIFLNEKHPELIPQFNLLLTAIDKTFSDTTPREILNTLEKEGLAFQATGFKGHGVLATLKNLEDGNVKLLLSERGARVGNAPLHPIRGNKFSSVRSVIIPKERRMEIIELLCQAKNKPQKEGVDILFKQIPALLGKPYRFFNIYQKPFVNICFYSNPKTGLFEQFMDILGEKKGRAFYKEFEIHMREKELAAYEEYRKITYLEEDLSDNPIIVAAHNLIEERREALRQGDRESSGLQ